FVAERGRAVGEQPRGVDLRGHLRDLELDGLEVRDHVAELLALARVAHRGLERRLGDAHGERGDADPPAVEDAEGVHEAATLLAEEGLRGHAAVLEDELGGVGRAYAELVLLLARAEALRPALDDEGGDALLALALVRHGHHHRGVGDAAVRDEGLRAVQDPRAAVPDRRGLRAPGVRARARLREAPAPDLLALRERRQVRLLLGFGPGE